jgi:hypothetical protein
MDLTAILAKSGALGAPTCTGNTQWSIPRERREPLEAMDGEKGSHSSPFEPRSDSTTHTIQTTSYRYELDQPPLTLLVARPSPSIARLAPRPPRSSPALLQVRGPVTEQGLPQRPKPNHLIDCSMQSPEASEAYQFCHVPSQYSSVLLEP